ncbi:MAG: Rpn family recombination-promoting nuclease/putative transposase [Ruminococcus sp.]|nr:Rpn family recombination-promoting nuclease/putative transposase [Ruminococcus sp.]
MEKKHKGISKTKDFRYPPIIPIVYYEGAEKWTAARNFKDRMQSVEEFKKLNLPKDYLKNLLEQSTDELLDIIRKVVEAMLRHLKIPEKEVEEFAGQVKERKVGELFEHFKGYDVPETRRIAREEGRREGKEFLLINMVCKKLAKGKTTEQIAEELEEEISRVESICKAAETFAPDYDTEKIYTAMKH